MTKHTKIEYYSIAMDLVTNFNLILLRIKTIAILNTKGNTNYLDSTS